MLINNNHNNLSTRLSFGWSLVDSNIPEIFEFWLWATYILKHVSKYYVYNIKCSVECAMELYSNEVLFWQYEAKQTDILQRRWQNQAQEDLSKLGLWLESISEIGSIVHYALNAHNFADQKSWWSSLTIVRCTNGSFRYHS